MPRGGKYPEDAVEILEMKIKVCPQGGGWARELENPEDWEPAPIDNVHFRKGKFCLDDTPSFEGWTTGLRWNGWAMPLFELEEARKIMAMGNEPCWTQVIAFYPIRDVFVCWSQFSDEPETWKAHHIVTPEGVKKVYPCGSGSWTWSEIENEETQE